MPVVENGEVIALLDITKCLYDAIARLEKAAEKGDAIAAAVQGVERQYGNNVSGKEVTLCLRESCSEDMVVPCITYMVFSLLFQHHQILWTCFVRNYFALP